MKTIALLAVVLFFVRCGPVEVVARVTRFEPRGYTDTITGGPVLVSNAVDLLIVSPPSFAGKKISAHNNPIPMREGDCLSFKVPAKFNAEAADFDLHNAEGLKVVPCGAAPFQHAFIYCAR